MKSTSIITLANLTLCVFSLVAFGNTQGTKTEKPEDRPLRISLATRFVRSAEAESFIVKNGQARAQIVLGDKPARVAKLAARELQTHVEMITGATLAIVSKPTGEVPVGIYVGRSTAPRIGDTCSAMSSRSRGRWNCCNRRGFGRPSVLRIQTRSTRD